mmetsp:Transcript_40189/g.159722  ORF Transcript_40189/g.159722 Transcript_40189/m.159722 type:complete len:202 (-) Transcript_40189:367-972(-)
MHVISVFAGRRYKNSFCPILRYHKFLKAYTAYFILNLLHVEALVAQVNQSLLNSFLCNFDRSSSRPIRLNTPQLHQERFPRIICEKFKFLPPAAASHPPPVKIMSSQAQKHQCKRYWREQIKPHVRHLDSVQPNPHQSSYPLSVTLKRHLPLHSRQAQRKNQREEIGELKPRLSPSSLSPLSLPLSVALTLSRCLARQNPS